MTTEPTPSSQVLRYEVPVDDQWHRIDALDDIVHVGCRRAESVEFWATDPVTVRRVDTGGCDFISAQYLPAPPKKRRMWEYRVFGTGHPAYGLYVGTALAPAGGLVWHLFRREVQP